MGLMSVFTREWVSPTDLPIGRPLYVFVFTKRIYQETDFLSTEGHLLASSGCILTLASSLDVVQARFAVVPFCL